MIGQLIYILCYGLTMAGLGLWIGYRWGKSDGHQEEYDRWMRLRKIDQKNRV